MSEYKITIKTLTGRVIEIDDIDETFTIKNVKKIIDPKMPSSGMNLIYNRILLENPRTLQSYDIEKDAVLYMTLNLGGSPRNCLWTPFLDEIVPQPMTNDISCDKPIIKIKFQNSGGIEIKIATLIDLRIGMERHFYDQTSPMQNKWIEYLKESQKPHPAPLVESYFWSEKENFCRIILVKLRPEFYENKNSTEMMTYIEQVKYNTFGVNKTYYGGDTRSWQRYTNEMPIESRLLLPPEPLVQLVPIKALEPNTWYAVVLLHNNQYYDDRIYEDYLIPFKTESNDS